MADPAEAARQFADLAKNLTLVGEGELRAELYKALDEAAQPLAREISNPTHLRADMPDRYADVFARDLKITVSKRTGGTDPGVTLLIRAPTFGRGGRKVIQRNAGVITHPVFGQAGTPRRLWRWKVQTAGMRAGFVDSPVERSAPLVREKVAEAVRRVEDKALGR
jgi:hypothetical protein